MRKLMPITHDEDTVIGYFFECPGCRDGHFVTIYPHRAANGAQWQFDGDLDQPTFQPSILQRWDFTPESKQPSKICHLFLTKGKLHFLGDCTHSLANQVVDLPDLDD
jgi:hypothetical protein